MDKLISWGTLRTMRSSCTKYIPKLSVRIGFNRMDDELEFNLDKRLAEFSATSHEFVVLDYIIPEGWVFNLQQLYPSYEWIASVEGTTPGENIDANIEVISSGRHDSRLSALRALRIKLEGVNRT